MDETLPHHAYSHWTPEQLTQRILELEKKLEALNTKFVRACDTGAPSIPQPKPSQVEQVRKDIERSKYSTRYIALKFAYLGGQYNGYEYAANSKTPLPTIEEVLWKALMKARLIFPSVSHASANTSITWDGCEYSKCGRTDKGVSAFGQVIGIRVRSNQPLAKPTASEAENGNIDKDLGENVVDSVDDTATGSLQPSLPELSEEESPQFDAIQDELPYVKILNRLLPPDIRILAWCPDPPEGFSARFSCRERRYRYFFTQPAFNPTFASKGLSTSLTMDPDGKRRREGWLDIAAMNEAAAKYKGLHDFRNLCKIDASKQLDNFVRRIYVSEVREVAHPYLPGNYVCNDSFAEFPRTLQEPPPSIHDPTAPKVFEFVLHGTAFLWHQVRHMVAILFLVGQGLETPDIVDRLLDVEATPQRPVYEMADDAPLVLWDCVFAHHDDDSQQNSLEWIYAGDESNGRGGLHLTGGSKSSSKFGVGGLVDDTWKLWRQAKLDEFLKGSLLNLAALQGQTVSNDEGPIASTRHSSQRVYQGGTDARFAGRYVPIMERGTRDKVEVINQRYAERKGLKRSVGSKHAGSDHQPSHGENND